MKCCDREMTYLDRWDDAQVTDHCFNLYLCEKCGTVCKEDVWEGKGILKIDINNDIKHIFDKVDFRKQKNLTKLKQ